jgi:hypothetical protein
VAGPDEWLAVNDLLYDFHDGVVRAVLFDSSEWVDRQRRVIYGGYPSVRVLVQLQSGPVPAARLSFSSVRSLEVAARDVSPGVARRLADGVWEVEFLSLRLATETCTVSCLGTDALGLQEWRWMLHDADNEGS